MAKERIFNLPETKGTFQLRGKITGHDKDNFYKESTTKTGKLMRRTSFGVTYEDKKTMYVSMQGMTQDNVYFSKPGATKGEKAEIKKVPWAERFNFKEDGFQLIGNNIGVTKAVNSKGDMENVRQRLTDFDSIKAITDNLKDDDSVFIKGNIEYSSFTNDEGERRNSVKLVPNQVSLCKSALDFSKEDFEPRHEFSQVIVFDSIEQEKEDDKPTGRFVVNANIINYASIEDAEFIVTDSNLAKIMKKNLSPYFAIKVWGNIVMTEQVEEVQTDNVWGESNKMERQGTPVKREFIITGADPSSIDKDTYSEISIAEAKLKVQKAQAAKDDFGSSTNESSASSAWGSVPNGDEGIDEDIPW
ncbi:hypothetical protein H8S37_03980 [Mediterraneibacter sp. NSJ-55]|uniref:Uncharacterized protein n=1 Tax=Mediterraneibacter hominis TaxID=2763054 RepID=A0A923LH82_9FIRM|nr:hypothetical protein [Mediterraneibacter hominis]MBC5688092.1 hypothetical protein [Mediterraneibacter hominis]